MPITPPALRKRSRSLILAVVFVSMLVAGLSGTVHAHGLLLRGSPPSGAILASAPSRIDLWFSEELDGRQSAIEVYTTDQQRVDDADSQVDPADRTHLSVSVGSLPDGAYTVAWRSASTEDGHLIRGTFNFQIGQGRLPIGAATVEGQRPQASATVLRWGTLLGLAFVSGWFLLGLLAGELAPSGVRLALLGAALALVSDLLAVPMLIWWGNTGARAPDVGSALALMTSWWYLRVGLELLLGLFIIIRMRNASGVLVLVGATLSAFAVLTLTFSSHAAADAHRLAAISLNVLHLESVIFWFGGLVQLAFVYRKQPDILRRFSRLAVPLFIVALATGLANAGFIIPSFSDLWESPYGQTLLLKTLLVLLVLGFAWLNRRALRRSAWHLFSRVRTLRLELAVGASVLLIAAILALSATPGPAKSSSLHLRTNVSASRFAHLSVERADVGRRDYTVWLTDASNVPISDLAGVDASFSMLERTVDPAVVKGVPTGDGSWVLQDVPITVKGWWQASLDFRDRSGRASQAEFILLLPDPSLVGYHATEADQDEARQLFDRVFSNLLALKSTRVSEVLSDGIGNSVSTSYEWVAPDRLAYVTSSGTSSIAIGSTQFYRDGNGPWESRQRVSPVNFPLAFEDYYSGADQIKLGRKLTIDGTTYQLLTFHVPAAPRRDQSWYAWWIDTETGQVSREAMAAQYHYMDSYFRDINAPIQITAPNAVASE